MSNHYLSAMFVILLQSFLYYGFGTVICGISSYQADEGAEALRGRILFKRAKQLVSGRVEMLT